MSSYPIGMFARARASARRWFGLGHTRYVANADVGFTFRTESRCACARQGADGIWWCKCDPYSR